MYMYMSRLQQGCWMELGGGAAGKSWIAGSWHELSSGAAGRGNTTVLLLRDL